MNSIISDYQPIAGSHTITLSYEADAKEPLFLQCDYGKLRHAISNIIDNAIRFNKSYGIVEVSLYHEDERIKIMIKDSGIGIAKEKLPYLFSSFNKGGKINALHADNPGIGISLYLSKLIVEAHKGSIEVTSEENIGTMVTITLPNIK